MEIWKTVPNFERYEVSDYGRIRNKKNHKIRKLSKPGMYTSYFKTVLYNSGKQRTFDVHRLVAESFCKKPKSNEPLEVDHINKNTFDNRASNLRWLPRSENRNQSKRDMGYYSRKDTSIVWFDEKGIIQGIFKSCTKAGEKTGFSRSAISKCVSDNYPRATKVGRWGFKRIPTVEANKLYKQQKKSLATALAKDE